MVKSERVLIEKKLSRVHSEVEPWGEDFSWLNDSSQEVYNRHPAIIERVLWVITFLGMKWKKFFRNSWCRVAAPSSSVINTRAPINIDPPIAQSWDNASSSFGTIILLIGGSSTSRRLDTNFKTRYVAVHHAGYDVLMPTQSFPLLSRLLIDFSWKSRSAHLSTVNLIRMMTNDIGMGHRRCR